MAKGIWVSMGKPHEKPLEMRETSKCYQFRLERGDFTKYLKRIGIDIGCGDDVLRMPDGTRAEGWDLANGDAMLMEGLRDNYYDFVYSSHCLEHMANVEIALKNWARILKPGGYLYIVVPDFILYEKCSFPPSRFNGDHKATFSLFFDRMQVGRDTHYGWDQLNELMGSLGIDHVYCMVECNGYDFTEPPEVDQTIGDAVAQICYIGRKQ